MFVCPNIGIQRFWQPQTAQRVGISTSSSNYIDRGLPKCFAEVFVGVVNLSLLV